MDKNTPLCFHPLLYKTVWSSRWRVAVFSQIPNINLRILDGAGVLSRFPKVVAPLRSSHLANCLLTGAWTPSFMKGPSHHTKRVQGNQHIKVPMVQHQDEEGYILFYIFYLKTKQTKKKTTTEEGNEKIKLLFCNDALLAWKVLEQMPCPPLNIHNISL